MFEFSRLVYSLDAFRVIHNIYISIRTRVRVGWLVPLNEQKHCFYRSVALDILLWYFCEMEIECETDIKPTAAASHPLNYCFIFTSLTLMLSFFLIFLFVGYGNARRKAVDVQDELQPLEYIWNADVEINYFAVCFCRSRWVRHAVRPLYPPLVPFVNANNPEMRFICDDTWEQK